MLNTNDLKKEIIYILKELFPENKKQSYILLSIIIFYLSYCIIICIATPAIIQGPAYLNVDTYFSFDNKIYFYYSLPPQIRHPLIQLFICPIVFIGNLCNYILGLGLGKRLFISLICSYLIASSVLYIYKYLTKIIGLRGVIVYAITYFFAFFSTNMILCFTIETYTISSFFLSFSIYYSSLMIKEKHNNLTVTSGFLSVILGGITVTNFIKGLIPLFFSGVNINKIIKTVIYSSVIFLLILITIKVSDTSGDDTYGFTGYYTEFSETKKTNLTKNIIDIFIGSPILLSSFFAQENEPFPNIIILNFYHHWWQYCIIGIIFALVAFSSVLLYKNKFVLTLCALFSIDLLIHVILKFGIESPYIYGAHWVYLVPLFIGWLYLKVPKKSQKSYTILIFIIAFTLFTNNLIRVYELIDLAHKIYQ